MKKETSFRLNGKAFGLTSIPPAVHRLVAVLSKLPNDELIDVLEIGRKLHATRSAIYQLCGYEEVAPYKATVTSPRKMVVFGNAATIKRLRKGLEAT